jgi:hypothetical protein
MLARDLLFELDTHAQTGADVPHCSVHFEALATLRQLDANRGSRGEGLAGIDVAAGPAEIGSPRAELGSTGEFDNFRPKNERIAGSHTPIGHLIWHCQISFAGAAYRFCAALGETWESRNLPQKKFRKRRDGPMSIVPIPEELEQAGSQARPLKG